jgi:hypothetical protein
MKRNTQKKPNNYELHNTTKTKCWEVPNIASRNTKANIFQEGSAGFKATVDMNK